MQWTNDRKFSFGMAEYCFQTFLIIVLAIVLHRFKRKYLFSFITAFVYGSVLDVMMNAVNLIPGNGILQRIVYYNVGLVICAIGVSLLFHTYIPPEAYELVVKEISSKFATVSPLLLTNCSLALVYSRTA